MSYSEGSRDQAEMQVQGSTVPWYMDPVSGVKILIVMFAGIGLFMTTLATFRGAHRFLPEFYVAGGLTALLVGVLAFSSVLVSDKFTFSKPLTSIPLLVLYLAAVSICWIFSFASYNAQFKTNSGSDLAESENALANMQAFTLPLEKDLIDRASASEATIAGNPELAAFANSMVEFAKVLESDTHRNEVAFLEKTKSSQAQQSEVDQKKKLAAEEGIGEQRVVSLQAKLKEIEREINDAGSAVERARQRVEDLKLAISFEYPSEFQSAPLPKPAPKVAQPELGFKLVGNLCRNLKREIGKGDCLTALERALPSEEKKLTDLSDRTLSKSTELATTRIDLEAAEKALASIKGGAETSTGGASPKGKTMKEQSLLALAEAFKTKPSRQGLDDVAASCEVGRQEFEQLKKKLPVEGGCRPPAIAALVGSLNLAQQERDELTKVCSGNGKTKEIISDLRTELKSKTEEADRLAAQIAAFDAMKKEVIDPCMAAAESAGIDTSATRLNVADFLDRRNPSQDEIGKASGKVMELFTGEASSRDYFPAGLALAQELSLLLAKIGWGAVGSSARARRPEESDYSDIDLSPDANDTANVAAAKNLLRVSGIDVDGLLAPSNFDGEDVKDEMRTQMKIFLNRLVASGRASRNRKGFSISQDGVAEIVETIRKHQSGLIQQDNRQGRASANSYSPGWENTAPNYRTAQKTPATAEADKEIEIGKMRNGDAKPEMPKEVRPLIDPFPYE